MEYLVLSEECLSDFTINEDKTVTLEDGDEQDVVVIPLQYVEQVSIADEEEYTYTLTIKPSIPVKELQRLMFYAAKSSADECWFHLTFDLAYITFK